MKNFKNFWEIQKNWQLLFPFVGCIALGYISYKLSNLLIGALGNIAVVLAALIIFYVALKLVLFIFLKLEKKWSLDYKWEMIRVFIVFAITGSSSMIIGRPIIKFIGIDKEILNPILYWFLFIIIGLVFYQLLLLLFGWLLGQFQFFWEFEKKMLRRFGLKRFLD